MKVTFNFPHRIPKDVLTFLLEQIESDVQENHKKGKVKELYYELFGNTNEEIDATHIINVYYYSDDGNYYILEKIQVTK